MQFQISDGDKYRQVLTAEISAEEMELALRLACKRLSQKANIPGFRKGKAPRSVLESYLGTAAILDEAAEELVPQAWTRAVMEKDLQPVDRPEVEITQLEKDKPMIFTATYTVRPQVTLGEYKGLELTRRILEVTDEDVEKELEAQRQRLAKLVELADDQEAAMGDTVTIDFAGYKDDTPFEGGTAENYPLELGSNSFIPGFEEQLVGLKKGEDKDINVTFPENYHQQDLANQPVVFKVHVHEIKRKEIPALDDTFVQEVSETCDTLEQFKEELRAGITEQNQKVADEACQNAAIKKVVDNTEVDIPPVMIEDRLNDIVADMDQRLQQQGLNLEQFFAYTGGNMADLRANYYDQAAVGVKTDLVLDAIINTEKFEVSAEDMAEEIHELSVKYWQPEDKVREALLNSGQMSIVEQGVRVRKAIDLIFNSAVITDEQVTREQLEKEREEAAAAKAAAKAAAEAAAEADIIETADDDADAVEVIDAEVKDAE